MKKKINKFERGLAQGRETRTAESNYLRRDSAVVLFLTVPWVRPSIQALKRQEGD